MLGETEPCSQRAISERGRLLSSESSSCVSPARVRASRMRSAPRTHEHMDGARARKSAGRRYVTAAVRISSGLTPTYLRYITHIWYNRQCTEGRQMASSQSARQRIGDFYVDSRAAGARRSPRHRVPGVRLEAGRARLGRDERGDDPPRARRPRRARRRPRLRAAGLPRPRRRPHVLDRVSERRRRPARRDVPRGRRGARGARRSGRRTDRASETAGPASDLLEASSRSARGSYGAPQERLPAHISRTVASRPRQSTVSSSA